MILESIDVWLNLYLKHLFFKSRRFMPYMFETTLGHFLSGFYDMDNS